MAESHVLDTIEIFLTLYHSKIALTHVITVLQMVGVPRAMCHQESREALHFQCCNHLIDPVLCNVELEVLRLLYCSLCMHDETLGQWGMGSGCNTFD